MGEGQGVVEGDAGVEVVFPEEVEPAAGGDATEGEDSVGAGWLQNMLDCLQRLSIK